MKKLFTGDLFFAIITWVALMGGIPFFISLLLYYSDNQFEMINLCVRIMTMACLAVTYIAYKKHAKNVMKGMMGAILFSIVVVTMITLFEYPRVYATWIPFVLTVFLFVHHFVINFSHHSNPVSIALNQCVSILFAVMSCVASALIIPSCVNAFDVIAQICICIAQPCAVFSIVCIESRLDAYRLDRENAGWTEEKGYPENYVHEFEKKGK